MVERAIQDVQAQMRTMKLAVEWRYGQELKEEHPILPWLVRYSAMSINLARKEKTEEQHMKEGEARNI